MAPSDNENQPASFTSRPQPVRYWIPINKALRKPLQSKQAHVWKAKSGTIYASAGSNSYKLNSKAFSHCEVIGFDGVGCYR
jgi:serine protease